jgi:hypothetical protein
MVRETLCNVFMNLGMRAKIAGQKVFLDAGQELPLRDALEGSDETRGGVSMQLVPDSMCVAKTPCDQYRGIDLQTVVADQMPCLLTQRPGVFYPMISD